ncbi:MAG TPA: hypothetical protein PL151_06920 [Phycisphaerae bacterium]|nr:hypothetical protein [Phycisphaerae bacterium]HOJ73584.1 hypothetical protein [Phycisphaerae bacterium]HOM51607.1 hypothetical protein [Phycisphaerae bacterium]HON65058.1 hypothetical protein [Phycisphaerae bacterium]HOQ85240.1 hypothetical protein [Phycisphaerae bacterium]
MMTDRQQYTLEVLNNLYVAEKRSLLPRLAELGPFVEWAHAGEMEQVRRMIAEEARHGEWLAEAADRCRGVLECVPPDASTANLHYCGLQALLPRVVASVEKLVETCARALQESSALEPEAAETIARIHHQHQVHLEQLRAIQARLCTPAA